MQVFSPTFDYLYDIGTFLRMQTVRKYIGKSMLTLVIAAADDAAYYLQKNGWIVDEEPFIIKHIQQGMNDITITAYGGHQLLTQRVIAPGTGDYAVEYTGSSDAVVKYFIDQSKRGLPLSTAAVQGGVTISDQSRWKNLGDEVARVLTGSGRGEKFDIVDGEVVFDTYLGVDRSRGNPFDNPPVVFDLRYKNIDEYTYTEDATVEQTTVYVGGQGEGDEREIIITGNSASGIDRTEVFIDARDVEKGDEDKLTERAAQATIPTAQSVSAGAVADANLVYGKDYNLGDIVTTNVPVKSYIKNGDYYDPIDTIIQVNQRITEVTITREAGQEQIDLAFGDQPITQTQTQKLRADIAQLKAVEPTGFLPLDGSKPMTGVLKVGNDGLEFLNGSAITMDQWGNIRAKSTVSSGASWNLFDYNGNSKISIPIGSNGGIISLNETAIKGKLLWSGSWNSGTITVSDFDKYSLFQVQFTWQATDAIAFKHSGFFRGMGGYTTATPTITTFQINASISGTVLTMVALNAIDHLSNGAHSTASGLSVSNIIGLV